MSKNTISSPSILRSFPTKTPDNTLRDGESTSSAISYVSQVRSKLQSVFSQAGKAGSAGALAMALSTGVLAVPPDPSSTTSNILTESGLNLKMAKNLSTRTPKDGFIETQSEEGLPLKWSLILTHTNPRMTISSKAAPDTIVKRVSVKDFEDTLRSLIGTPYVRGVSDCSGIIRIALQKLRVIDKSSSIGSATTIMRTLTRNNRNIKEARRGDFAHWISRYDKTAHHIAYITRVEVDGIWVIDGSTDEGSVEERFIPKRNLNSKNGVLVGTPTFLQI